MHVEPSALGAVPLGRINVADIEQFIAALQTKTAPSGGRRLRDSSIARVLQVVKVLLDDAVIHGLLAHNPMRSLRRKALSDVSEHRYLSATEITAVLEAARPSRYFLAITFLAATGLRKGELIGLRWTDIDLSSPTPRFLVSRTVSRLHGGLHVGPVKSSAGRRTIPITDGLAEVLRLTRLAQDADRDGAGDRWANADQYVFTTQTGAPLDPRNLLRAVYTAASKAGLEGVDAHSFRHSAATAMLESGVHLKAVSVLLGHSNVATTARIYAHVSDDVSQKAMQALSRSVGL